MGQYKFQKMGRIGSTEMYLIWEVFGIMVMFSGHIIITGSTLLLKNADILYEWPLKDFTFDYDRLLDVHICSVLLLGT